MADQTPITAQPPLTFDALLADRLSFWSAFTGATTLAAGAIVVGVAMLFLFVF